MDLILKTTVLCKNFKGQTGVNNVSLNIQRNSVYGLLGPNGAGKSTTLKMITGILKPTSGSIEFDGHLWQRSDLAQIGALIETPPLYENLTAYKNLKVRTTMLRLPEKRIDEVLHIVRLTDTGRKRTGQFSLGMKQRLGIVIALLNSPQLLILSMKFGLAISLFWGVFECLQCILYSNIELQGFWRYIPFSWSVNWVQDVLNDKLASNSAQWMIVSILSAGALLAILYWFVHWEGRKNNE